VAGQEYEEARARLERDYLAGSLSADEYTRLRRELHETGALTREVSAEVPLASWGSRAAASILDWIVVIGVLTVMPAWGLVFGTVLGFLLLPILYFWLMVGAWDRTLGKMALGVRVVRAADGGRVGYPRALGRVACIWMLGIFVVPLLLAYLWPLWDERNQTLYDKLVETVVVKVR
jgi:uncharacterized RDD family membrane protein YckC